MKFYICYIILGIIFGSTGVRALRKPAPFHHKNGNGSPYYESKTAIQNENIWNSAQKMYGAHMTVMGVLYILLSLAMHPLYIYVLDHVWKRADHTIPFFCLILIPLMILIGLANGLIELRLKKLNQENKEDNNR